MQTAISNQTSETQDNIDENSKKIIELISKDKLVEADIFYLKEHITSSDIKIQVEGNQFLTAIGYAIFHNKLNDKLLELFTKKLKVGEKLSELKAHVFSNEDYLTVIGFAIFHDKLNDKLLGLFQGQLVAGEKLSELKAKVFSNRDYITAIGFAIFNNKLNDKLLELFQSQLVADEKLSELKAYVFSNEDYLTAIGYAILNDKLEKLLTSFPADLKDGEKLSEMKAYIFKDEKYLNLLQYSINQLKIASVKLLIQRDPSSVNLVFGINGKSALKHATSLYQDNIDANSKNSLILIIKILLENGAKFEEIEQDCPPAIKTEIDKIKETKKIYNGDQDTIRRFLQSPPSDKIDDKINLEYLKLLFKESGIPAHLMPDRIPQSEISKIIKEIATTDSDFLLDLDVMLGNIAHYNSGDDQIVMGYNTLQTAIEGEKPNIPDHEKTPNKALEKCIEFYKSNPQFITNDFLEYNDESTIAGFFLFAPMAKERLFQMSEKWILPQEIHLKIKNIKQELSSVSPSAENAILLIKSKLAETKQRIVELEEKDTDIAPAPFTNTI